MWTSREARPEDAAGEGRRTPDGASGKSRPIDLVHLTRQTFGDKRLETELLRLFLRQAQVVGQALSVGADHAGSRQDAVGLLHQLCGSARAVGATEVSAVAERLERARRLGTSPDALTPDERRGLDQALTAATTYIGQLLDAA